MESSVKYLNWMIEVPKLMEAVQFSEEPEIIFDPSTGEPREYLKGEVKLKVMSKYLITPKTLSLPNNELRERAIQHARRRSKQYVLSAILKMAIEQLVEFSESGVVYSSYVKVPLTIKPRERK